MRGQSSTSSWSTSSARRFGSAARRDVMSSGALIMVARCRARSDRPGSGCPWTIAAGEPACLAMRTARGRRSAATGGWPSSRGEARQRWAATPGPSTPVGRGHAGDDVVRVTHREALDVDAALPGVGRSAAIPSGANTRSRSNRAVLQLDEVLAPEDLRRLGLGEIEPEFADRSDERGAVLGASLDEQVRVLRRVGKPQQDGARLADEEIPHTRDARRRRGSPRPGDTQTRP